MQKVLNLSLALPLTCARSYKPINSRLSTDTRLITSTTAFAANACRQSLDAVALPLSPDTSPESSLTSYRPRVSQGFVVIPELSAALAAAKFPPLACPPPSTSATGDADASTYAATQPSAVLGHFALTSRQSLRSSVYAPSSSANLFLPYQSESSSERSSLPS